MLDTELILHASGITSNYKGYWLLADAIEMVIANPEIVNNMVDGLYSDIGKKFGISAVSVERNMHTAITRAWQTAPHRVNKALGRTRVWRPTVSEFIDFAIKQLNNQQ